MTKGKHLFDTNIWICFFSNNQQQGIIKAREIAKQLIKEADVYLSIINIVELLQRLRGTKRDENVKECLRAIECFPALRSTAELAGKLASIYAIQGQNLTTNDCLIAATAIENNLTLVSADAIFKNLKELKLKFIEI